MDAMYAETLSREPFGVVFKPGRLMSTADVTYLLQGFKIAIPRPADTSRQTLDVTSQCYKKVVPRNLTMIAGNQYTTDAACKRIEILEEWLNLTVHALRDTQREHVGRIVGSLPEEDDRIWLRMNRTKRAGVPVLDVIGELSYHLFGTARSKDVEYNRELIETLNTHVKAINKDLKDLSEYTEETFRSLDLLAMELEVFHEDFLAESHYTRWKLDDLTIRMDTTATVQAMFPMVLEEKLGLVIYYLDLMRETEAFSRGVQYLLRGKLSVDLVPPDAINRAVKDITMYLQKTYPRFEVAFKSPSFYYDNASPMFVRDHKFMAVYIRIPVVAEEHLFRVYQVMSFPVPVRIPNEESDALQIVNLPAQVAVSLSKMYYIPMPNVNWAGCYGDTIVLCKDIPYMKRVTEETCIAGLLRDDRGVVIAKCDTDFLLNPDFGEMAVYLDDGQVLVVSAEKEGQLICGNQPPVSKRIEHYAKLRIGCDCAFQTKGAWIPYSLRNCDSLITEYTVEYPSSGLLEARLHVKIWQDEEMEAPMSLNSDPLPPTLRSKLKEAAEGYSYRVPLTDLINRIKGRDLDLSTKDNGLNSWWPTCTIAGIAVVVIVVICCVVYRVRSGVSAMVLATQAAKVTATRGREYCPPVTPCPPMQTHVTSSTTLAIILILLVIVICFFCYKRRRTLLTRTVDGLYVQFSTPQHVETVFLGEVEIPHAHIFTEGRTLVRDCVVNQICLRSTLRVRWEMKLRGAATRPGEHPVTIPLPETVFVSRHLSRYLLGPGKTSTMVRLLRYSSGLASPVPSGVPRLIDAGWTRLGGRTQL